MSRARPIAGYWFDTTRNGEKATEDQIELLVATEAIDFDDLLDEHPTQGDVMERLRDALGENRIPDDVLERRELWRQERHALPPCRKCGKKNDSTKHHFVNRWLLLELVDYAWKWSPRTKNTIPLCVKCHREIHKRIDGGAVSIVKYLDETEKAFAQAALDALADEHPRMVLLLAKGADSVYESRLIQDWIHGKFHPAEPKPITPAIVLEQIA